MKKLYCISLLFMMSKISNKDALPEFSGHIQQSGTGVVSFFIVIKN